MPGSKAHDLYFNGDRAELVSLMKRLDKEAALRGELIPSEG